MQTGGLKSKTAFAILQREKAQIELELRQELTWYDPPDVTTCRAYLRRPADLRDRKSWLEYFAWLLGNLEALHRVFAPRVKALNLPDDLGPPGEAVE